ncbi:MAG: hypothetical protein QOF65_1183, partial [Thermoleophilaceae bacterium]|nr:hypothetical protein [Thermoleophilaceae bacterium]
AVATAALLALEFRRIGPVGPA